MITEELIDYIEDQLDSGVPEHKLRRTLKKDGEWSDDDIDEAMAAVSNSKKAAEKKADAGSKNENISSNDTTGDESVSDTDDAGGAEDDSADTQINAAKSLEEIDVSANDGGGAEQNDRPARKEQEANKSGNGKTAGVKVLLGIVILLVVLLAGGGGVFAYYQYFAVDYDKVLNTAIANTGENIENIEKARYDATLGLAVQTDQMGEPATPSLRFEGAFDVSTQDDPRLQYKLNLNDVPMTETGSPTLSASGEARLADKVLYLKATGIPNTIPMVPKGVINAVTGKWISVSRDSLIRAASSSDQLGGPRMDERQVEAALDQVQQRFQQQMGKAQEQMKMPLEVYEQHPYLTVTDVLSETEVGGEKVYHLRLAVQPDAMVSFADALVTRLAQENPQLDQIPEEERQRFIAFLEELPSAVTDYNIEVFITKEDKRIVQQDSSLALDPDQLITVLNDVAPQGEEVSVPDSVDLQEITFEASSRLGSSVRIEAPQSATPVDEVVNEVQAAMEGSMGGPLTGARAQAADARVMSNLSSMRSEAELYYTNNSNSYNGFCESDGYNGLAGDVVQQNREIECRDSADAYVVYAPLAESDDNYFCVDSQGAATELSQAPNGITCGGGQARASGDADEGAKSDLARSLSAAVGMPTGVPTQSTDGQVRGAATSATSQQALPLSGLLSPDMIDSVTLPAAAIGLPF